MPHLRSKGVRKNYSRPSEDQNAGCFLLGDRLGMESLPYWLGSVPEARVASVTLVGDTRLLRLDQEPFFELMQERIEVARGIIQVLTRYLRGRVKDLAEMRSRIEALEKLAG